MEYNIFRSKLSIEQKGVLIIRQGNLDEISKFLDRRPNVDGKLFYEEAILCGNLHVVEYLSKKGYYLFAEYIVDAVNVDQYDIARWILDEKGIDSIDEVVIYANIKTLEWLYGKGYRISDNSTFIAIYNDNSEVLEWLIAHDGTVHSDLWYKAKRLYKLSHMIVLHRTADKNILEEAHKDIKRCLFCMEENKVRIEHIKDLWIMDVESYDNGIQWLPREMLEDTTALI